ncbi:MAG: hypothetical protein ACJAWS_000247 [Oleiphilaceae bacterium]|jgi:hypothetical protein
MKTIVFIAWLIAALVLLNGNSAIAATSYYRWQDAKGDWQFSDKAPIKSSSEMNISKVFGQNVNISKPANTATNPTLIKLKAQPVNKPQKSKQKAKHEQICQTLEAKLDTIHRKLRAGYKEPKGNKLRAQRRRINNKIYKQC